MTTEKTSINIIFGKNIKFYRKKKKLTQESFGELVGVSSKYISNIECGLSFPSSSIISLICSVLDVQPYKLFVPEETEIENPYSSYVSKEALKAEIRKKLNNLLDDI